MLALIVGAGLLAIWLARPDPPVPAGAASDPPAGVPDRPADAQQLTVRYVYDGDTLQLQAARPGTYVTTTAKIRVRLIGIDAPEMRPTPECYGPEATARLRELAGPGSRVWVAPDQDSWDRYQRRLFFVWTADGRLLNYDLVAEGYADAIRVRPNVTYWPLLRQAAADAKDDRRGLWGACPVR
ncbi:MAG TPA: thermonuclease family protein [Microlunatus sp.]